MNPTYCTRCDQPNLPGEPYDTHVHHAANRAGWTNYSHQTCPGLRRTTTKITTRDDVREQ